VRDVGLVDVRGLFVPIDVAGVRRKQLVDRRERSGDVGQIEELDLLPVDECVERVHRAAERRAERDERSRVPPSVEALEEITCDQPAHRVADEHELGIVRAARRPPLRPPLCCLPLQAPRRDAVVAPPVVRELEEVLAAPDVERLLDVAQHLRVAVDLPEAGKQVDVTDDLRRGDSVAEVVHVRRVLLQLQIGDAPAECGQRADQRAAGDVPDVPPVLP
jgi:hypothetical protein